MKKIIIIAICLVVVMGGIWLITRDDEVEPVAADPPVDVVEGDDDVVEEPLKRVEIFANTVTDFGIDLTTTFTLKFEDGISENDIYDNLALEPSVDYTLSAVSANEYLLTPSVKLLANTVYSIAYDELDYGKAFQTVDDIRIYESFPGQEAYDVPTKSVIELKFNINNITDISDYFSITPEVEGTFEYSDSTVIFMPEQLEAGVYYQVEIQAGLMVGNREMTQPHKLSFTTGYGDDYNWNISYSVVNLMPDNAPILGISTWNNAGEYNVKIYQAPDFGSYHSTYQNFLKNHNSVDFSNYTALYNDKIASSVFNFNTIIELPKLENGRYIVLVEGDDVEQYIFLQVDPHQVYYAKATNGELFWIVNAVTHQPENNAAILSGDTLVGNTNSDGVFLTGPDDEGYDEYVISIDGKSYIVNSKENYSRYYYYDYYYLASSDYWSFIYTDRSAYLSDDEISIFGFLRSYTDEKPEDLRLTLSNYWSEGVLEEIPVELNDDLSFTAKITIENFDYGYYNLQLKSGDKILASKEVSVLSYEKPEILMVSEIAEDILFADDMIHYTLNASYFNELPYENMVVGIRTGGYNGDSNTYTTNAQGDIILEVNPSDNDSYWYPNHYEIYASNESIEDTYLYTSAYTTVLPRDTMIRSDYDVMDLVATVDVETHLIDISNFNGSYGENYENLEGEAVNKSVEVGIVDVYYEKVFLRTEYDPIHKLTYDVYQYNRKEENRNPINVDTLNGMGQFSFEIEEDHYYQLTYTSTDSQGRVLKASSTLGVEYYNWYEYEKKYTMLNDYERYDIGDIVEKEVLNYGETIASKDEDFALHLILRNGILEYKVTDDAKINFEFEAKHRPNVLLKTIYFDGFNMNILPDYDSLLIGYDYELLEATMAAKTNQNDYKPGESVTMAVDIENQDGTPFNGKVNVSVVDEAYFALFEDYFNLGNYLHAYSYYDGILHETVSNEAEYSMDGAEAGEGGDDGYIRDDFKDTAVFETIDVINGRGVVVFDLPDNLTKWRITLNAVNEALEYASDKINITVSLPYFVRSLYNTNYLTGDDVYVTLKSDGEMINEGDEINYTVELLKQNVASNSSSMTVQTKGVANGYLGVLEQGDYEILVTGQSGEYEDGIKEPVKVRDTFMFFDHMTQGNLTTNYQLKKPEAETLIFLYNQKAREYQNQVFNSYRYDLERIEEIIARFGAYDLLENQFESYEFDRYDVSHYQSWDGGIKPLLTADASVDKTALIAGTKFGVSYFDKSRMIEYLKMQLENTSLPKEEKTMVLWALAAQDEPVLLLIDGYLSVNPYQDLSPKEQLYIAMALYELNDKTRLFELSQNLFEKLSEDQSILTEGEFVLAASLAILLNHDDVIYQNLTSELPVSKYSVGLQRVLYMYQQPTDFEEAKATLIVNGQETTYSLPGLTYEKVIIAPQSDFRVISIQESVHISEVYQVSGLDYDQYDSKDIHLEKHYLSENIKQGDIVEVSFEYEKPINSYVVIRDVIPAGFEYAGPKDRNDYYRYYYIDQDNQNIRIPLYSEDQSGVISYYIKAVQVGSYKTEPAVIQMFHKGALDMTTPEILEVQP